MTVRTAMNVIFKIYDDDDKHHFKCYLMLTPKMSSLLMTPTFNRFDSPWKFKSRPLLAQVSVNPEPCYMCITKMHQSKFLLTRFPLPLFTMLPDSAKLANFLEPLATFFFGAGYFEIFLLFGLLFIIWQKRFKLVLAMIFCALICIF